MAKESLINKVPIPWEQVHRIRGEDPPVDAAAAYEDSLRENFGFNDRFDLILLGLGKEGHTASLFPGQAAVGEKVRWVLAERIGLLGIWRITLTPVFITRAREIIFIVTGAGKAASFSRVYQEARGRETSPAAIIARRAKRVRWLVDRAAASELP
jgi:6-phosphogluconolactonase